MSDSESDATRRIHLGEIDPCGSRQAGRRSGVALTEEGPVVGLADGSIRAFDDTGVERWRVDGEGSAITIVPFAFGVLVGERSAGGAIRVVVDGEERWRHETADVLGEPTKETRFFLPMVVDAAIRGETAYVAARRYERRDGTRRFESAVYALDPSGGIRWRYDADASPISLAVLEDDGKDESEEDKEENESEEELAIAYNRCPGTHDDGLVVLDGDGEECWSWDPDRNATRRVGDVAALDGSVVVTSHADYRGYRIDGGEIEWRVDLGRPQPDGDEVYAYPNHVTAGRSGIVFVTGNSFPKEGRETDERHPNEQSAFGYAPDGEIEWRADVGGFCHGIASDGDRMLAPVAQHFRERDPSVHGLRRFDIEGGLLGAELTEGVCTAAAIDGDRLAVVEEPIRYHDGDGSVLGSYSLRYRTSSKP